MKWMKLAIAILFASAGLYLLFVRNAAAPGMMLLLCIFFLYDE